MILKANGYSFPASFLPNQSEKAKNLFFFGKWLNLGYTDTLANMKDKQCWSLIFIDEVVLKRTIGILMTAVYLSSLLLSVSTDSTMWNFKK